MDRGRACIRLGLMTLLVVSSLSWVHPRLVQAVPSDSEVPAEEDLLLEPEIESEEQPAAQPKEGKAQTPQPVESKPQAETPSTGQLPESEIMPEPEMQPEPIAAPTPEPDFAEPEVREGPRVEKPSPDTGETTGGEGLLGEEGGENQPKVIKPGGEEGGPEKTSVSIPTVLTNIDDCKRVGLLNDKRVQVALREVRYTRYKLGESEREFFPKVKANWERQQGESQKAVGGGQEDFVGLKYGLEANQILFNGGKLTYTQKQAKNNLEIAKKKYDQARQEVIFKVEKAYYTLVKAQMSFEIQADLSKAAEAALSFAREAYRQGLNSYHEFLNIQSQTDQTYYQLLAAQQEIALAELGLRQACNVDASTGIQINAVLTFTDFDFNYSLDECMELAFKNRPDLAVNELTTLTDVFGIRLAEAEAFPKVELIANSGKSGQSQNSQGLEMGDEWGVKLQASWALGGNTAQYGYEKKQSVPVKYGSIDNITGSTTQSLSVGVFDKMENFSNDAKARVQKATSEADWVELKGKVANEVDENYFNYQKTMTMVTASLSKIKFREKDLEINRAKQMMNDVPLSQVLTSELQLGEERVNYVKALADYYTSISGLFKAMGLSK